MKSSEYHYLESKILIDNQSQVCSYNSLDLGCLQLSPDSWKNFSQELSVIT